MTAAEAIAVKILISHAEGRAPHVGSGACPDAIEGPDTRDPDCPVCAALVALGKRGKA